HAGGDNAVLKILFYQLCNFLQAPVIFVFVFDGPEHPSIKRGKKVINCPPSVIEPLKGMIESFGYYFCDAPGEAEAELAQLNKLGFIDAIITEDSDALVFGATCIIRTLGPSVAHNSLIYTADSVENTDSVSLSPGGLLLFVLLVGGDYNSGIDGCGPMVAHALALHGLGDKLLDALTSSSGAALDKWRDALRTELRTNSSGLLGKRHPKLAESIPSTFPDLEIAQSYLDPLTSWSSRFVGVSPDPSLWVPREPSIHRISTFCLNRFQWNTNLLKKLESNLWPGVAFKMISSVILLHAII
ncbi:PIN domain-like protein, partial [Mycena sp. CBHHK59/15]